MPYELVAYALTWYVVSRNNPVIALVNAPVPAVLATLVSAIVGLGNFEMHIPLAVIAEPPAAVTFPPPVAVVDLIAVIAVVVTVGGTAERVVKLTSLP